LIFFPRGRSRSEPALRGKHGRSISQVGRSIHQTGKRIFSAAIWDYNCQNSGSRLFGQNQYPWC